MLIHLHRIAVLDVIRSPRVIQDALRDVVVADHLGRGFKIAADAVLHQQTSIVAEQRDGAVLRLEHNGMDILLGRRGFERIGIFRHLVETVAGSQGQRQGCKDGNQNLFHLLSSFRTLNSNWRRTGRS